MYNFTFPDLTKKNQFLSTTFTRVQLQYQSVLDYYWLYYPEQLSVLGAVYTSGKVSDAEISKIKDGKDGNDGWFNKSNYVKTLTVNDKGETIEVIYDLTLLGFREYCIIKEAHAKIRYRDDDGNLVLADVSPGVRIACKSRVDTNGIDYNRDKWGTKLISYALVNPDIKAFGEDMPAYYVFCDFSGEVSDQGDTVFTDVVTGDKPETNPAKGFYDQYLIVSYAPNNYYDVIPNTGTANSGVLSFKLVNENDQQQSPGMALINMAPANERFCLMNKPSWEGDQARQLQNVSILGLTKDSVAIVAPYPDKNSQSIKVSDFNIWTGKFPVLDFFYLNNPQDDGSFIQDELIVAHSPFSRNNKESNIPYYVLKFSFRGNNDFEGLPSNLVDLLSSEKGAVSVEVI